MAFADKTLTCVDCGASFAFTASEQELFANKGYQHPPKRCAACREERRSQRYGSGGGSGGGWGGSGSPSGSGRGMYPVVCAACGAQTEVPFQPRGDRPVYCAACYSKRRVVGSR